jgi:hypothetical protein
LILPPRRPPTRGTSCRPGSPRRRSGQSRSDWAANATWFQTRCSWETINHESCDCGQFGLFRKGQWLTKEWSGHVIDGMDYTTLYHNNLSVQNDTPATVNPLWSTNLATGSQWNNGGNNGDSSIAISVNDNWAYELTDSTNLYNHPNFFTWRRTAR